MMLSYSWDYRVVDAIQEFCQQNKHDPQTTRVWICFVCLNQFRTLRDPVPFSVFRNIFQQKVQAVEVVLGLLVPWTQPIALSRAWCAFEFFSALKSDKLAVIIPQSEWEKFEDSLDSSEGVLGGVSNVLEATSKICVEHARATHPQDKANVLKMIIGREDNEVALDDNQRPIDLTKQEQQMCTQVNADIIDEMKRWYCESALVRLEELIAHADNPEAIPINRFCAVAWMLASFNRVPNSCPKARDMLAHAREKLGATETLGIAQIRLYEGTILRKIGASLHDNNQRDEVFAQSLDSFLCSKRIFQQLDATSSVMYSNLMAGIGLLQSLMNNMDQSLEAFEEMAQALDSCQCRTEAVIDFVNGYKCWAITYRNMQHYDQAIDKFEIAMEVARAGDQKYNVWYSDLLLQYACTFAIPERMDSQRADSLCSQVSYILNRLGLREGSNQFRILQDLRRQLEERKPRGDN
ncbi:Kinesin light chain [Seminavis robusta]|uniref:Kinesin light chain n=1 Tax=Seminavis robusta TaxID=568900 RepID=A0A9N8DW38_9STRA|nr:Kinesin light chain [Seminavis robusta]|eukprot:Sro407_g136540.1 Kinesin light chain (465) ;mRNA; r:6527-7921